MKIAEDPVKGEKLESSCVKGRMQRTATDYLTGQVALPSDGQHWFVTCPARRSNIFFLLLSVAQKIFQSQQLRREAKLDCCAPCR